jgi:hypothetical protein
MSEAEAINPVINIHMQWMKKKTIDNEEEATASIKNFIEGLILQPFCKDVNQRIPTKCTCLHDLQGQEDYLDIAQVATYLTSFACCSKEDEQRMVMEWVKYAKLVAYGQSRKEQIRRFLLPGHPLTYMICKNALAMMIGFGQSKWTTVTKLVKQNKNPTHGLRQKTSNNSKPGVLDDLHVYFDRLKDFGAPRATPIVRNATGIIDVRDEDTDLLELPTSITKRGQYRRYCNERGWVADVDAKGNFGKLKRM